MEIPVADAFNSRSVDGVIGLKLSPDQVIAGLAGEQHGVVGRRQMLAAGLTSDQIRVRVERGSLHVVYRGVYAAGHGLLTRHGRLMAAVLACGSGAVASHRWAGWLWGVMANPKRVPEITRETGWHGPRGVVVHRSPLPSDELCVIDGIPATGLARTFLDLAMDLQRPGIEQALNEAEVLGLTDRLSIPHLLKRYPRRSGTAVLRRILAEDQQLRGITRRELEARFKRLLDRSDIPPPKLNHHVSTSSGKTFEVDCLWAEHGVIVELDGRAVHGTPQAFERDREKDRVLTAEGWRVARVTWLQLRDDADGVLADLRRTLRLASRPTL